MLPSEPGEGPFYRHHTPRLSKEAKVASFMGVISADCSGEVFQDGIQGMHGLLSSAGFQFRSHVAGHGSGIGEAGPVPGTRAEHSNVGVMITRCSVSEGHLPPCGEWKLHKVPSKKFYCRSPPFHRTPALCCCFFLIYDFYF